MQLISPSPVNIRCSGPENRSISADLPEVCCPEQRKAGIELPLDCFPVFGNNLPNLFQEEAGCSPFELAAVRRGEQAAMDFQINERQRLLSASARDIYERKLKGLCDDHGPEGTIRLRREMAQYGLLGVNMPAELGGSGLPLLDTLLLTQT